MTLILKAHLSYAIYFEVILDVRYANILSIE